MFAGGSDTGKAAKFIETTRGINCDTRGMYL